MKTGLSSCVQSVLCVIFAVCALSANAAPEAIATVNGKPITKQIVELLVKDQGMQGKPQEAEFRKYAKDQLIQREVMAQRAEALKLDKTPAYLAQLQEMKQAVQKQFEKAPKDEVDARIAFNTQGMQAQLFVDDFQKKYKTSDAEMHTAYKKIIEHQGGTEYKVRHIQLDSEADAKAVIAKLATGAKFETLAAESKDAGSKDQGGDLGWGRADAFPASFAEAVRKLAPKGYSREPVKTDEGYHVILVEGARELPVGTYDSYKAEISDGLKQQALGKEIQELMKKAKIS